MYVVPGAQAESVQAVLEYTSFSSAFAAYMWCC